MNVVLMIVYAVIVLGFLVIIHEAGHYFAARAFGVRVSEFMLGLPGPSIGFTKGGTKFGVTPFLLGGYAKVCGMEAGQMSPHLEEVLGALYRRGSATMEEIAADCDITDDEAYAALEELVGWGSALGPTRKDKYNTYRTPALVPTKKQLRTALRGASKPPEALEVGSAREIADVHSFFESEYRQQYRSLPFWKRSIILVAGVAVNLAFAIVVFVVMFSIIGVTVQNPTTGALQHVTTGPLQAIQLGFVYIGLVVQAVAGLFNPATAVQTVQGSASIIGIAAMSKAAFDAGLASILQFFAMISVSLGVMNLLPIPPLDGGRFVIELFQKVSRRVVSTKALNYLSLAGVALFACFFLFMANQDIQRIITGAGFGGA